MPQFEDLLPFEKFIPAEKMSLLENTITSSNEHISEKVSNETQKLFELIDELGPLGISEEDLKVSANTFIFLIFFFNFRIQLIVKIWMNLML